MWLQLRLCGVRTASKATSSRRWFAGPGVAKGSTVGDAVIALFKEVLTSDAAAPIVFSFGVSAAIKPDPIRWHVQTPSSEGTAV